MNGTVRHINETRRKAMTLIMDDSVIAVVPDIGCLYGEEVIRAVDIIFTDGLMATLLWAGDGYGWAIETTHLEGHAH